MLRSLLEQRVSERDPNRPALILLPLPTESCCHKFSIVVFGHLLYLAVGESIDEAIGIVMGFFGFRISDFVFLSVTAALWFARNSRLTIEGHADVTGLRDPRRLNLRVIAARNRNPAAKKSKGNRARGTLDDVETTVFVEPRILARRAA